MPIEPVKIPQNVYIEDRIVGPLTLKQIIIMAIGGGISYVIYASLTKMYGAVDIVTTVIVWMPAVIFAAFALVKINDLTLARIVLLTIERMSKAPVRTWTPRTGVSINIRVLAKLNEEENSKRKHLAQKQEAEAQRKIHELSSVLDQALVDHPEEIVTAPEIPTVQEAEEIATVPVHNADDDKKTLPVRKDRISVDGTDDSVYHMVQDIVRPPSHA